MLIYFTHLLPLKIYYFFLNNIIYKSFIELKFINVNYAQ